MQNLSALALACLLVSCVEAGADTQAAEELPPVPASTAPEASTALPAPSVSAAPKRASIAEVLAAIPEDPAPPKIIKQTHYFVSNEHKPEAFRKHAEGLGGIYVGVGAEQNYLFAGWARPKVLILADFDQWVVDVHYIHGVLLRSAPTADAFVKAWSRDERKRAIDLIEKATPDPETRERILEMFRITRPGVYSKLLNQQFSYRGRKIATWLSDRSQYDHIAGLYRKGHVRSLRGDFTGKRALSGIASAARQLDIPVRAIYLSNVEDYFHYSSGLGDNLLAQPVDDRSLLLRTLAKDGDKYLYLAQRMVDFRAWLGRPGIDHRIDMMAEAPIQYGPKGKFLGGPD